MVLIVDDDVNQLSILSTYLKQHDYIVEPASSGPVGIRRFKDHHEKIGLIVTDMQMPMMTGEEFIKKINELDSEIPIFILSGTGLDFSHLQSITNVKEILQKPIEYRSFHEIVGRHFKKD